MSTATIKQYGEMGIRLVTLHNSHQMSSWPCSVLVIHFILVLSQTTTKEKTPQLFNMFKIIRVIIWLQWTGEQEPDMRRLGRSVSGTISRVLRWLLKCWADWAATTHSTPQLTGRGWALIWECQNLLLSHHKSWWGRLFVCKWNILAMCVYVTYKWAYLE